MNKTNTSNKLNTAVQTRNNVDEHGSVVSILCRICYDAESNEELITPCRCKGTVAYVHRSCLETWLAEANATNCELCHQVFLTQRSPKYKTGESIWRWCRYQPTANEVGRGVIGDIVACAAITPMAIVITYICLFSSDYYNQKKFAAVPAAKWTSVSLLVMIGIMLIGYYLWVFSILRMHISVWYNWWQRECIVRYIPDTNSVSVDMDVLDNTNSQLLTLTDASTSLSSGIDQTGLVLVLPTPLPTILESDSEIKSINNSIDQDITSPSTSVHGTENIENSTAEEKKEKL